MEKENDHNAQLRTAIESFWKVFPPLWHYTRSAIHHIASEEFGITTTQYHILRRIRYDKKTISELSNCMFVSRPNISRAVEDLVNGGWAHREKDRQDRRVVYLSLTEKGSDLIRQMKIKNDHFMSDMLAGLTAEELQTITKALDSLGKVLLSQEKD
jgi:DNA-binding MarR family transcriptional regulator